MKRNFSILLSLLLALSLISGCGTKNTEQQTYSTPFPNPTAAIAIPEEISSLPETDLACSSHKDIDDDGFCDICNEDVLAVIDLYVLNDLHGKIADTESQPGVDEMSNYLKTMEMLSDNYILFSSGDMWQGTTESSSTKGLLMTEWMNEMNFVAMTLGNHEFDWGTSQIEKNLEIANFPFLALNIFDRNTNKLASYCQPSVTVECEGVKVGIIGAIGDCYSSISKSKVKDVYFAVDNELASLIKKESEKLRSEGCEVIILSIHDGYGKDYSGAGDIYNSQLSSYYDINLSKGVVDIVFEAHTHKNYVLKDSQGIWHIQDGGDNKVGISHARLSFNKANDNLKVNTPEIIQHSKYKTTYAPDPAVGELLDKYSSIITDADRVFTTVDRSYGGNELRQLCADLYYEKGLEKWGKEYDIVLGGGYFSVRSPGALYEGDVTYSMLYTMFPFDNQLVLCSINGIDLNNDFFNSRNNNYFLGYGAYGEAVRNRISPTETYYIVVDEYTSDYYEGRSSLTPVAYYDDNIYSRDLLREYFSNTENFK